MHKVPLLFAIISLFYGLSAIAEPYPLGTMTSDDIGEFASEAMRWRKEEEITYEEAMARLDERTFADPVEKKNLSVIVNYVFGNYGRNWNVEKNGVEQGPKPLCAKSASKSIL